MTKRLLCVMFGFLFALTCLELALRVSGHIYYQLWTKNGRPPRANSFVPNLRRILCVGDSWTFGLEAGPVNSYPAQLQRILDKKTPRRYKVYNCGIPSCTSTRLLKILPELMKTYRPDIVLILIDMNDIGNPPPSETSMLSGKSNRFFPPLSRAIMDLRICKVWRWSIAALRRKSRVFKRQNGMPWRAVDHNSLACSDKGAALHAIGQSASAIKYLMKALDIDPNNERAYYHLAVCYQALGNLDRSVLACKKMLNVNPFTRAREDIYRLLFLIYQNSNSPHDEIAAIMNGIPSDAIFTNPGPPFSLNATVVGAILRRNLESMITLIQSQKALPILQLYPGYDWFESQKMELSRKFNIPCICHRNFSDLRGKKNYWGHTHPNKNGYRLMAENAYAVITGRFLPACPHSR